MVATSCKRVSFKEDGLLDAVHHIPCLDDNEVKDLFYSKADYRRFRWERNVEMQRQYYQKMHAVHSGSNTRGIRRATRRSSIDLIQGAAPPPSNPGAAPNCIMANRSMALAA